MKYRNNTADLPKYSTVPNWEHARDPFGILRIVGYVGLVKILS